MVTFSVFNKIMRACTPLIHSHHLTWIDSEMGGKWLYSCCFVGWCFQDLFKRACSIRVLFPANIFLNASLECKWCSLTVELIWLQLGIIPILFHQIDKIFSIRLFSVHGVHLFSSIDTTAAWKKRRFILSVRCDFDMTDSWPCLRKSRVDVFLGWWDAASDVGELVYQFQRTTI